MATTPPFLTQIQLAAAQAEAEGYQNGPNPTLNSANLYTQDVLGNNQVVPVVVSPVPYYPDTDTTPNLQLSLKDLSAQLANNFVILDGAIPVIESFDFFAVAVPETFHFTPLVSGLYQITSYIAADPPSSAGFAGDAMQIMFMWRDYSTQNLSVLTPSDLITTRDGQPGSGTFPIYAAATFPVTVNVVFTTYSIAGTVLTTTWFVTGAFSGTPWAYGTTITQAGSGATAFYYGTFNNGGLAIIYRILTGVDNGGNWSQGGVTFTTSGSPTQPSPTMYGPGGGVLVQSVTGATGAELDALSGTGVQHIGPGITGTPDATHAWIDAVTGGVLIPSAVPALDEFGYDVNVRVALIGSTPI